LKSAIEQLAQKLPNTTLWGNNKEAVNVVATTQATQITESKREIEELKNLLRASNKNYSDMMKQSRDVESHEKSPDTGCRNESANLTSTTSYAVSTKPQ
jgi:small-conductance mechanosensitive channel